MLTAMKATISRLPGDRGLRTEEYRPFPNVNGRNWKQQRLEIPAMIRALSLPRGASVLEVGCGRGCALTVLGKLLAPTRLVGLDIEEEFLTVAERSLGEANVSAELLHGDVRDRHVLPHSIRRSGAGRDPPRPHTRRSVRSRDPPLPALVSPHSLPG